MHKSAASGTAVYIYAASSYGTKKPPQGCKNDVFCTPVGAVADCLINIVASESFSFFSYRVFFETLRLSVLQIIFVKTPYFHNCMYMQYFVKTCFCLIISSALSPQSYLRFAALTADLLRLSRCRVSAVSVCCRRHTFWPILSFSHSAVLSGSVP